ncbi:MAG TPA: tyrosine-type recombinase/integrase [Mycobacteriales bacterium]|nr:tyrosine-type recombinase/integrase [Mycobacteriales bacterium]
MQRRQEQQEYVQDGRITVAQFLEYWLTVVENTVRPRTFKRYAEYVRVHTVPVIGHVRLAQLKPLDLQQLYSERMKAGSSPSTVQHLHATLHRALAMAERWEYVTRNVARHATPPRVPRFKIRPLTVEQVRRLLAAAAYSRFEAAVVLAVVTGMRLGELFALRWCDIDLGQDPVIHVRGSLQRVDGLLQIVEPKTAGSVRDVALSTLGVDALRRQRAQQAKCRLELGDAWQDHDLVLPNSWGRYMAPDYFVRREFARILDRAGLPRMRFHDLRHTFATLQLSNQQPVKVVSEMMGHTRTAITQDLYTHVSAQMQRTVANALDDMIRSCPDGGSGQDEKTIA